MGIKLVVACDFLTEKNKEEISTAAEKYGYDLTYFSDEDAASGSRELAECEVLYTRSNMLVPEARYLKWMATCYAGAEAFMDPGQFANEDVIITNSAGAYGVTISEYVIMTVIMMLRQMPKYQAFMREKKWARDLTVRSIFGSRVAILGTGDIGSNVARRMKALGAASVTGFNRTGKSDEPAYDRVFKIGEIDGYLPDTDILSMSMPDTPETKGILSKERIALLPGHAVVVNVGRGTCVDQGALVEALNSGKIAGAALDVMVPEPPERDDPVWDAKNLILTPHVAGDMSLGYTVDTNVRMFTENMALYAEGKPLKHVVDRKLGY